MQPSFFPGRLAFGILDDGLLLNDLRERYHQRAKLCRQVDRIGLGLKKLEHPIEVIDTFENRLSLMVFATAATNDLGVSDRTFSKPELAILVERIVESVLVQMEVMRHLLERIIRRLHRTEKDRLASRVSETIREGLETPPWDDTLETETLFDLNEPVRFRLSLFQHNLFPEAAWATATQISQMCHN